MNLVLCQPTCVSFNHTTLPAPVSAQYSKYIHDDHCLVYFGQLVEVSVWPLSWQWPPLNPLTFLGRSKESPILRETGPLARSSVGLSHFGREDTPGQFTRPGQTGHVQHSCSGLRQGWIHSEESVVDRDLARTESEQGSQQFKPRPWRSRGHREDIFCFSSCWPYNQLTQVWDDITEFFFRGGGRRDSIHWWSNVILSTFNFRKKGS